MAEASRFNRVEMRDLNRDESKHVPDPKMRPAGMEGPATLHAMAVMMSQGLETMHIAAFGENASTLGTTLFMMATFRSRRFRRDSPGC